MIQLWNDIKTITGDKKAFRSFGLLVGFVLVVLATVSLLRHSWQPSTIATIVGSSGVFLLVCALLAPGLLRPFHWIWMALAMVLGFFVSHLILALVFYLILTPIGLFFRLKRRDPLRLTSEPEKDSYWIPKVYRDTSPKRFEKYY